MVTVDTIGRMRYAFHVKRKKIKAIARELRLAGNTVWTPKSQTETIVEFAAKPGLLRRLSSGTSVDTWS